MLYFKAAMKLNDMKFNYDMQKSYSCGSKSYSSITLSGLYDVKSGSFIRSITDRMIE